MKLTAVFDTIFILIPRCWIQMHSPAAVSSLIQNQTFSILQLLHLTFQVMKHGVAFIAMQLHETPSVCHRGLGLTTITPVLKPDISSA